jgi:hypothetical protein
MVDYIHLQDQDIPQEYKNCRLHIALERADTNKDWQTFRNLYKLAPEFLKCHLNMTGLLFDYNYLKLDKQTQNNLFN